MYNPADFEAASEVEPLRPDVGDGRPVVVMVAQWRPQKDHETAVRAAAALRQKGVEAAWVFVGEEQYPETVRRVRAIAQSLGVLDLVHILGRRTDVLSIVKAADVAVLATHFEGLPVAVIEYAAMGIPSVVSEVEGTREIVDPAGGIIGVPPRDPEALAQAVFELLSRPERARALGREARLRMRKVADIPVVRQRVVEVYRRVTRGASHRFRDGRVRLSLGRLRPAVHIVTYGAGRSASVVAQLLLIGVLARTLARDDLGRISVALSVSAVTGLLFGLSARRLAMYREDGEPVRDLEIAVALSTVLALAVSYGICHAIADSRTGLFALVLALWRGADAYGEIGQGLLCRRREFRQASLLTALRAGLSTLAAVVGIVALRDVLAALWIGAGVRGCVALVEVALPRPRTQGEDGLGRILQTVRLGTYLSVLGVVIMMIDTAPTILLAHFSGLETAAVLAPLGRLRYGVSIIATTVGEVVYPDMMDARWDTRRLFRQAMRGVAYFAPVALAVLFVCAAGAGEWIFGPVLAGQHALTALAVAAGSMLGITTLISSGLTAREDLGIQIVAYGGYLAMAILLAWALGWTVTGMYLGQTIGSLVALGLLMTFGYGWRPEGAGRSL
ncbi:MAG: hypothetical protein KatS3mg082_3214 [Nitrospiraceae bacterium]|nr:MAG: hypothetical protein KatS3mg082_3214 [Nitrospiraceae bacterium]